MDADEDLGTEELETSGSLSADNEPASAAEDKSATLDDDPLEQLDAFRRRAVRFAKEMTGLEETYRLASKANPELAESHLRQILERLDRVGPHLELPQKQSQEVQ